MCSSILAVVLALFQVTSARAAGPAVAPDATETPQPAPGGEPSTTAESPTSDSESPTATAHPEPDTAGDEATPGSTVDPAGDGAGATQEPPDEAAAGPGPAAETPAAGAGHSETSTPQANESQPLQEGLGEDRALDDDDETEGDGFEDDEPLDDYDPLADSPEAVQARRRIQGGIILLAAGVLLSVGAIALGTSDPCAKAAGNSCQKPARTRAALTMGIPGGLVTAGGAILLGFGLHQRKQIRLQIAGGRHGGTVGLVGRF